MPSLLGENERISDRVVVAVLVVSMALGLVLYGLLEPSSSDEEATATPVALTGTPSTSAPASATPPVATTPTFTPGGSFGSGSAALDAGMDAGQVVGSGGGTPAVPRTPTPPPVPAPACAADTGADIYESVVDPLSAALGEQLPRDNVRLLAQVAAGCTSESPTTPLLGLALDIGRLVPDTGLAPVDLTAIPGVAAPEIPDAVIDALAPLQPAIMEACGNVGMLGVLMAVVPGAANVPVNGSQLVDLIVPATTLCAQFEG